jgi:hypothetical protein
MHTLPMGPGVSEETWLWWESRRLRYNLALAAAGWTAWGLYAVAVLTLAPSAMAVSPGLTLVSTLFLGVLYLLFMGAANVCFLLGPAAENLLAPSDPESFRRRAWALGMGGSVALPFAFPALTALVLLGAAN